MRSKLQLHKKTIIAELADAISSFNIAAVSNLLSDEGKFAVQNENYEIQEPVQLYNNSMHALCNR
jgi:hypothetical protein